MQIRYCGVLGVYELCDLDHACPYTMHYRLLEFESVWKRGKYGCFIREKISREKVEAFYWLAIDLVPFIVFEDKGRMCVLGKCHNAQKIYGEFFAHEKC